MKLGVVFVGVLMLLSIIVPNQAYGQNNAGRTCPEGTYVGLDNQGNQACRDLNTNQIVDARTGLVYDSQTGNLIFEGEQLSEIIWALIIILIVIVIVVKISKMFRPSAPVRKGWTVAQKEKVRVRQKGKCAVCRKPPPRWEYDHKDGDRSNNSLSNCQGLCPNCHSTKTYG